METSFLQKQIEDDTVILHPLKGDDFEHLYAVASDPKIWEQHPNKDRWKKEVFEVFFTGALESGGAYLIVDRATGTSIGSTRYYEYDAADSSIKIGYTFYATQFWGKGINPRVKTMMLDHIFNYVSVVKFDVGASNLRSQIAISRLGAEKISERLVKYFGEEPKLNFTYQLNKETWKERIANEY
ncbi:GNAT family N-acetyltransferase [Pedobacter sp. AW1-32]|uniref:GNAT family N-acetyltransferase n=1 Tax=Pedobacter sp. AW1-32 TaxID=3383026 RepID=UPI003FF000EB